MCDLLFIVQFVFKDKEKTEKRMRVDVFEFCLPFVCSIVFTTFKGCTKRGKKIIKIEEKEKITKRITTERKRMK